MDILQDIFLGNYRTDPTMTAQERKIAGKSAPLWEKAYETMGQEAADQLSDFVGELLLEECLNRFREGFRLGALLMLEVLNEPSK